MKQIAMVLLFDHHDRLLIYLRDDKPKIPFPNHWDFFDSHLEKDETPEQAMIREVKEELGIDLHQWNFFREYICKERMPIQTSSTCIKQRRTSVLKNSHCTKDNGS